MIAEHLELVAVELHVRSFGPAEDLVQILLEEKSVRWRADIFAYMCVVGKRGKKWVRDIFVNIAEQDKEDQGPQDGSLGDP